MKRGAGASDNPRRMQCGWSRRPQTHGRQDTMAASLVGLGTACAVVAEALGSDPSPVPVNQHAGERR